MTSCKTFCKGMRAIKSSFCVFVIFFMWCDIFYYMVITRHGIFSGGLSVCVCVCVYVYGMGVILVLEKGRTTINLTFFGGQRHLLPDTL